MAEYSMLKGRLVWLSLMTFVESAVRPFREGGLTGRYRRVGGRLHTFWNLEKNLDMMKGGGRGGV